MASTLPSSLLSVDWLDNVNKFLANADAVSSFDSSSLVLALWSKQLENVDSNNPALSFVRAMQSAAHHAVSCTSLGLYQASASSIRSVVENALYYSYFRTHPAELASLVKDSGYYTSKQEILAFHKIHTPGFKVQQVKFGLIGRIESWYSEVSAIVHGQVPGVWIVSSGISGTSYCKETLSDVVKKYVDGVSIVNDLILLTVGQFMWDKFSSSAKGLLIKGLDSGKRTELGLDSH